MKYFCLFIKRFVVVAVLLLFGCKDDDSPASSNEPTKVYISNVVASPTENESVTIKNNSGSTKDLTGWTIGDKNDPTAYPIPSITVLTQGQTKTFPRSTLTFQINDSGEIIYLKDSAGNTVDTWSN